MPANSGCETGVKKNSASLVDDRLDQHVGNHVPAEDSVTNHLQALLDNEDVNAFLFL